MATACTAPNVADYDYTSYTYPLSWSGASGGTSNSITGYEIQRRIWNYTKNAWDDYSVYKVVSSNKTSGSLDVASGQVKGGIYQIRIRTRGSAGSAYYSDWASPGTTRVYNNCTAPTSVTIGSFTNNNKATLSWNAGTGGGPDAVADSQMQYYAVYRSINGGAYTKIDVMPKNYFSCTVDVPADSSTTYTFKIQTQSAEGSDFDSPLSTAVATSQDAYGKCGAPTIVSVTPHETYLKGIARLTWNDGTPGTNNPVTGYTVWRQKNGYGSYTQFGQKTTSKEMFVFAPDTPGFYNYAVVTVGTAPGKNSDRSTAEQSLFGWNRSDLPPSNGKTNAAV